MTFSTAIRSLFSSCSLFCWSLFLFLKASILSIFSIRVLCLVNFSLKKREISLILFSLGYSAIFASSASMYLNSFRILWRHSLAFFCDFPPVDQISLISSNSGFVFLYLADSYSFLKMITLLKNFLASSVKRTGWTFSWLMYLIGKILVFFISTDLPTI